MAFMNEYVPDDDIEKYKLDEIWLKEHPAEKFIPKHVQLHWTVDRDRSAYLMCVGVEREEHPNRHTFIFQKNSESFQTKLDLFGSANLNQRPNRIIWELVGIWPSHPKTATLEEIVDVFKEALSIRGYDGARRQLPDTIVEFKNF